MRRADAYRLRDVTVLHSYSEIAKNILNFEFIIMSFLIAFLRYKDNKYETKKSYYLALV